MEVLGVLGSNKFVTTSNAALTEVFYGVRPSRVKVLFETNTSLDLSPLQEALGLLGVNTQVEAAVVGRGPEEWARNLRSHGDVTVIDVTPAWKYMTMIAYAVLGGAARVRYIYIKNDREANKVFGYIPLDELELWELSPGRPSRVKEPKLPEPSTGASSELRPDALTALLNLLRLRGRVSVSPSSTARGSPDYEPRWGELNPFDLDSVVQEAEGDDVVRLCALRSGALVLEGEDKVVSEARQGANLAFDTNVFINIGPRLPGLLENYRNAAIPLPQVYRELTLTAPPKGDATKDFVRRLLGARSFNELHPLVAEWLGSARGAGGDKGIVDFLSEAKKYIRRPVLVTGDRNLYSYATASRLEALLLGAPRRGGGRYQGELVSCLSSFRELVLMIDDRGVARLRSDPYSGVTRVMDPERSVNYGPALQVLERATGSG